MISFSLFKNQPFLLGCIAIFFIGGPLYPTMQLPVIFLDKDLGYAKHTQGLYLFSMGITLLIVSTCTAFLTKKINIRFLAMIGMGVITISCWLNPVISIYSNHAEFLLIWNLRMVGIGLALGPATALALSEIPLAVSGAASIFITLSRQVGGTIGTLWANNTVIRREIFHRETFGSQVDLDSSALRTTILQLKQHLIHNTGSLPEVAEMKATALIHKNILIQSHAVSINDAFYLMGALTFICFLSLIIEFIHQRRKNAAL